MHVNPEAKIPWLSSQTDHTGCEIRKNSSGSDPIFVSYRLVHQISNYFTLEEIKIIDLKSRDLPMSSSLKNRK